MTSTTSAPLSTRETRNVVTMLAGSEDVHFVAQALGLAAADVRAIHDQYGPGRDKLKQAAARLLRQLDAEAGRYMPDPGPSAPSADRLTRVPAIVHAEALDDRAWILEAIDYNLRRQGYTDDDKRRVARQLADLGVSHSGIAQAFGVTTAKLAVLIAQPAAAAQPVTDRPKRAPTSIGRRTLSTAVQDWRSRDADATTILTELENLLAPPAAS